MPVQYITIEDGKRLAVLPEAEYLALVEAAEDAADVRACDEIKRKLASGEEELIPAEYVNRMLDGENKVRVWREYRSMSVEELAEAAGVTGTSLSQIESGAHEGTIETLKKIAAALRLALDDVA